MLFPTKLISPVDPEREPRSEFYAQITRDSGEMQSISGSREEVLSLPVLDEALNKLANKAANVNECDKWVICASNDIVSVTSRHALFSRGRYPYYELTVPGGADSTRVLSEVVRRVTDIGFTKYERKYFMNKPQQSPMVYEAIIQYERACGGIHHLGKTERTRPMTDEDAARLCIAAEDIASDLDEPVYGRKNNFARFFSRLVGISSPRSL